jgi:outer membrane protein
MSTSAFGLRGIHTHLLAAACALLCLASVQAQQKIGVIDLKKVFDGYYKTKLADTQLKERGNNMLQVRKGMVEDGQKAQGEYNKLVEAAKDAALSAEERDKRAKNADAKLRELQEIEDSVRKFDQQSQITIDEQKQRMRENILRDIREEIDKKAKAAGFNLVLDSASETVNRTPVVLYLSLPDADITQEILTKLNSTAPPSALKEIEEREKAKPADAKPADAKPADAKPADKK